MENNHPKISCVLITREPKYPELVLDRLDLGFFDEILIHCDSPDIYRRYQAAARAKNEIIYVQDDDCFVNYQVLFRKYNGQLTNTMTEPFQRQYEPMGCTLVGWGCYFPKSMLGVFDKYIAKYGVDAHLLREADRIFTYLNRPHNVVIQPHENLGQATEKDRMCYEEGHYQSMAEALKKCENL